jgi:hypothetical protein
MAVAWSCNAAQWIRTALTDLTHAVEQARGNSQELVADYARLVVELEKQSTLLEQKYGVPPPTGVGRRKRKSAAPQS